MRVDGVSRCYTNPIYIKAKKHFCPKCGHMLSVIKVSEIVDPKSERAKKFDFSEVNTFGGGIKFIWDEFFCENCGYKCDIKKFKLISGFNVKIPIKYIYSANPIYVYLKKHYCPECKTKLRIDGIRKIVNSNSIEAKEYNFSIGAGDSKYKGDVEFRTLYFKCPTCRKEIYFDEMKRIEKQIKKNKDK